MRLAVTPFRLSALGFDVAALPVTYGERRTVLAWQARARRAGVVAEATAR